MNLKLRYITETLGIVFMILGFTLKTFGNTVEATYCIAWAALLGVITLQSLVRERK
jgi:hypothetical protein